jgi:hypothetical protein
MLRICWQLVDSTANGFIAEHNFPVTPYRPQSGIYTALGIGLALIALIIYAAIFGYR